MFIGIKYPKLTYPVIAIIAVINMFTKNEFSSIILTIIFTMVYLTEERN